MGSNYYMNEFGRSGQSSSPSPRKGKKSGGSHKPKQPQRGLGVAQLEKIRLHSQLGCPSYLPSHHHVHNNSNTFIHQEATPSPSSSSSPSYNVFHGQMNMGLPDFDRGNAAYGESQSSNISRWQQGNAGSGSTQHYFVEPNISARSFFEPEMQERFISKNKKESMDLMGSGSHYSELEDVDLELRL